MTNVKVQRKDVISDQEVQAELSKADNLAEFFRLRAKAVIALLETGKRRTEIASLERADVSHDDKSLFVRFTVVKKRKKNVRVLQRTKRFRLSSQWSRFILEYIHYIDEKYPNSKFMFPRIHAIFGQTLIVDENAHCTGQQIWRIVKQLNPNDWPHLHREKRAVKEIRADEAKFGEAKLETVYRVRNVLDLERETTAYNYIRRFEVQRVEEEEEEIA
jgi:integrase